MTSKTSLFNKGIYKSTARRFLWGSILYFIMLFLTTGMMLLLNEEPSSVNAAYSARALSTLLSVDYMILPMLLSMVVPTVVGLLVFRFVHSRKASVFVHSLPVRREANYVSSVLAALTLMAIPVILNTVVLIIMSVTVFPLHFSVGDCFLWMLLNLLALFIMFSAVCFVAMLTGNSFAMIGLNILFHTIALIISAAFTMVCEVFLYGFAGEADLLEKVFDKTFLTRVPTIMTNWAYSDAAAIMIYIKDLILFSAIAVALYVVSGFLYKHRRMETAEDVAGFNCLNAVFKYLVTFVGAIGTFAIASYSIFENPVSVWVIVFIISVVFYFGAEMLLKKTLRVWKSYKGYVAFAIAFAVMMCVFAYTNFFGYETYIPDKAKVESVAIYDYYGREIPISHDSDLLEKAIKEHENRIEKINILPEEEYETRLHIEYFFKNGRSVHRVYRISEDELHDIMNSLYENDEYKEMREVIFYPVESIISVELDNNLYIEGEQMQEFINCIKKDMKELSYNEIYSGSWSFSASVRYVVPKEEFSETDESMRTIYEGVSINSNYKHTIKWLRDNGLWENVSLKNTGIMYVAKEWNHLPYFDSSGNLNMDVEIDEKELGECIKIDDADEVDKIVDFCNNASREYIRAEDRYAVFLANDEGEKDVVTLTTISKDELRKLFPEKNLDKLN